MILTAKFSDLWRIQRIIVHNRWGRSPNWPERRDVTRAVTKQQRVILFCMYPAWLMLTPGGTAAARFRNPARVLIPAGTKFPLSQDRSVINVRTTWPANRRLASHSCHWRNDHARVRQVDIDRRNATLAEASPWIYIANRSLINCRPRHEIVVEFRSIIIIVDCGPAWMRPARKGDTNHSFGEAVR